jgi:hypothetical protein
MGFIKLLPQDYNYTKSRRGLKRIFDKKTGDMIGFLVPESSNIFFLNQKIP